LYTKWERKIGHQTRTIEEIITVIIIIIDLGEITIIMTIEISIMERVITLRKEKIIRIITNLRGRENVQI